MVVPDNFLPFGPLNGDAVVPIIDDGSSEEIRLGADVIIFGTVSNRLYVSQYSSNVPYSGKLSREKTFTNQ